MTTQPQPLRIADALKASWGALEMDDVDREAAAELRRLYAMNQELLEALKELTLERGMTDKARAAIAKAEGQA